MEDDKKPASAGAAQPAEAGETQSAEPTEQTEKTEPAAGNDDFKFNLAFTVTYVLALGVFFGALIAGKVLYGVAMFAFAGMSVQFVEFFIKSRRKTLLVTGILSGVAALVMFILSIVELCIG